MSTPSTTHRPARPDDPLLRGDVARDIFGGNQCGNTADNCKWSYGGQTGFPSSAQAPQTDVVVGVEVAYVAPGTQPALTPLAPVGGSPECLTSGDCPYGHDCVNGACTQPAPPIVVPGAVYGITKIYCADAAQVATGNNTATSTVATGISAPSGAKTGTLSAQRGAYALDGFQIVYTSEGATQVAASYRPFAHAQGSGSRALTAFLPAQATHSSQSVTLGCYSGTADLYLSGLDEAETDSGWSLSVGGGAPPQLGALSLGCTDYTDVFQMPDAQKVACCLGKGTGCWWGGYDPQSKKCDEIMAKYCRPLCAGGTCADPACNCLGSPLAADGVAQCFDARCANSTGAYRTKAMSNDPNCPGKNLTCAGFAALGSGAYVAQGVQPPTGCGGSPDPPGGGVVAWLKKDPIRAVVFIVFVILLAFALLPDGSGAGSRRVPKLPPGALPTLPPLATV